jgi:hypothetical protein
VSDRRAAPRFNRRIKQTRKIMATSVSLNPGARADQTRSLNMTLIGHHELDVFIDDRRLVFAVDRFSGGLYVLEMNV